jgi:glycerophosphoryl diester phosphodiesterase
MTRAWLILVAACGGAAPHHVDYEGHRGSRGLRPENTLDAFAHGIELGIDTLEMDVMLTADDVLVVHHDEHLNPDITRDANGAYIDAPTPALRTIKLEDLRRYDVGRIKVGTAYATRFAEQVGRDGVRIPTLEEVIAMAEQKGSGRIHYNIEVKTTPDKPDDTAPPAVVAERIVELARKTGIASRVTIQSFDWRALHRVRDIAPELPRSCLTEPKTIAPAWNDGLDAAGGSVPALVAKFGCTIWSPDASVLTEAEVAEAHRLHLAVLPWTVNERAEMDKLLGWGVDGIITDRPDRLPHR